MAAYLGGAMNKNWIVAGLATAMLWASSAPAALITWTVTGGKFDDGGTFSGTFVYDDDNGWMDTWDITSSSKAPFGVNYATYGLGSTAFTNIADPLKVTGGFSVSDFDPGVFAWASDLSFTNLFLNLPGTVSLTGAETYNDCPHWTDCKIVTRRIVAGIASTEGVVAGPVPEPASWAMMVGGFALVGGAMRSRRRPAVRFG